MRDRDAPSDIALRLEALAGRRDADRGALSRIRQAAGQYRRRLRTTAPCRRVIRRRLLAAAFPDRIAQRRGDIGSFRLSGGGGSAKLPPTDPLARASAAGGRARWSWAPSARIRLACPARPGGPARRPHHGDGGERARPGVRRRPVATAPAPIGGVGAGGPHPSGRPAGNRRASWPTPSGASRIGAGLDGGSSPTAGPRRPAAQPRPCNVPDLTDAALAAGVRDWLAPHLLGTDKARRGGKTRPGMLLLRGILGWERASRLDRDLPTHLPLAGWPRGDRLHATGAAGGGAGAGVLWPANVTPVLAGGRMQAAIRPALAGRPAGRHHGRPGRILDRRLGRCAPRHAGPLSLATTGPNILARRITRVPKPAKNYLAHCSESP